MTSEPQNLSDRAIETALPTANGEIDDAERSRLLAEYSTDVVLILALDGTVRHQSHSTQRIFGYAPGALIGQPIAACVHPDDLPQVETARQKALRQNGASAHTEFRFRSADGLWRYQEGVVNNLLQVPGIEGLVLTARDISPRKRAEEERRQLLADLAASETRLRNLLTQANCFLWQASVVETEIDPCWPTLPFDAERRTALRWVLEVTDEQTARQWLGLFNHRGISFSDTLDAARFPEEREPTDALSIRALREGWPGYIQDIRYRGDDGRVTWVHEDVKITKIAPGRWHLASICTDITQRKLAEQELRKAHEKLTFHMENLHIAAVEWDIQGRIRYWSQGAERIFGWRSDETIGKKIGTELPLVHPDDHETTDQIMSSILAGEEQPVNVRRRNLTRTGEIVYCKWNSSVLFDEEGRMTSVLSVGIDVTAQDEIERKLHEENHRAEIQARQLERQTAELTNQTTVLKQQACALMSQAEELSQARDLALAATRAKSSFLANMSHEIRTPMSGVLGMAELLLQTTLVEEQREYAQTIYDSGAALLTLLNDILDFSKVESGKLELEAVPFELRPLVESVQLLLSGPARNKGVLLRPLEIAPGLLPLVVGDSARLRQILVNVIGNAIKFTPEGGMVFVSLSPEANPDPSSILVRFEIRDTGIGISPEATARLFQPFAQADSSTTRRFGGTGLGLAISKQLVELMGGQIQVESAGEGLDTAVRGTLVRFTVRLHPARSLKLDVASPLLPVLAPPITLFPEKVSAEILVVEDNPVNRRLVTRLLEKRGYRITIAFNGREALERLEQQPFDLILMDCQMPEMDGFEATRQWRHRESAAEKGQHIPIIALTAGAMLEDRDACLTAGMDDYLPKPFSPDALYAILQHWSQG